MYITGHSALPLPLPLATTPTHLAFPFIAVCWSLQLLSTSHSSLLGTHGFLQFSPQTLYFHLALVPPTSLLLHLCFPQGHPTPPLGTRPLCCDGIWPEVGILATPPAPGTGSALTKAKGGTSSSQKHQGSQQGGREGGREEGGRLGLGSRTQPEAGCSCSLQRWALGQPGHGRVTA